MRTKENLCHVTTKALELVLEYSSDQDKYKKDKPRGEILAAAVSNSFLATAQSTAIGLLLTSFPLISLIACNYKIRQCTSHLVS